MSDKKEYKNIDLSDTKLFFMGLALLAVPLYILFFKVGDSKPIKHSGRLSTNISQSKGRAFNLVSTSKASSARMSSTDSGGSASPVNPTEKYVEKELDSIWRKMSSAPAPASRVPSDAPIEVKLMISAENDELLAEGNASLDMNNYDAAEKAFNKLLESASGNDFKYLHAWGGLMEVYMARNDKENFRKAFKNYALCAQRLRNVYGDMADSVARAYDMFEQIRQIDPGTLREQLTKVNLSIGKNVSFNDYTNAINETSSWFPKDLKDTQAIDNPFAPKQANGG